MIKHFFRCTYPSQWVSHCTAVGDRFRFRRELLHLPQLNAIATLKPTFTFLVGILPYSIPLLGKIPTKKVKVVFRVAMASQPFYWKHDPFFSSSFFLPFSYCKCWWGNLLLPVWQLGLIWSPVMFKSTRQ